ncbi:MAG: polysaccharide biosynthesis protein, partial [bacterium]
MVDVATLSSLATGRSKDLFQDDFDANIDILAERVSGARVLVIGGAGSIGSSTVKILSRYRPRALHIVDQNENGLVELVRSLRSDVEPLRVEDFRTLPLDYGAPVMRQFLNDSGPYDMVLNFAALKHVRSEKDLFSLTQLLDTNIIKQMHFMGWLTAQNTHFDYFCVSTDKAARPVSMMGASKRVMEHLIFSDDIVQGFAAEVTSARFANVAFSDGSLLYGFQKRME